MISISDIKATTVYNLWSGVELLFLLGALRSMKKVSRAAGAEESHPTLNLSLEILWIATSSEICFKSLFFLLQVLCGAHLLLFFVNELKRLHGSLASIILVQKKVLLVAAAKLVVPCDEARLLSFPRPMSQLSIIRWFFGLFFVIHARSVFRRSPSTYISLQGTPDLLRELHNLIYVFEDVWSFWRRVKVWNSTKRVGWTILRVEVLALARWILWRFIWVILACDLCLFAFKSIRRLQVLDARLLQNMYYWLIQRFDGGLSVPLRYGDVDSFDVVRISR